MAADLDAFKAQLDIIALAEACTEVKRVGTGGKILCPEHDDSDPSCQLYGTTNSYFCWSCKAHGDVFRLVMLLRNLSFPEALDWIAETANIEKPSRDPESEARSAALKLLRVRFAENLDTLPSGYHLPGDLTPERARQLGLGYAHDLAILTKDLPRQILGPAELKAWEGAWTLELFGRGGGILGFGAFLVPEPAAAQEPVRISPLRAPPDGLDAAVEAPEPEGDSETADEMPEVDPDDRSTEEEESTEDIPEDLGPDSEEDEDDRHTFITHPDGRLKTVAQLRAQIAAGAPARRAELTAQSQETLAPSAEPPLGRWVKMSALRAPSFAGLPLARETIARRKAVALSPDMATFIELQASGFTSVIACGGPLDGPSAQALATLAPQVIVVVSSAYKHSAAFFSDLNLLTGAGAHVELISKPGAGASLRLSLFEYLATAAAKAGSAGRTTDVRPILDRYLEAVPSRSSRELYAAELRTRGIL
jgi:hypothetical protein